MVIDSTTPFNDSILKRYLEHFLTAQILNVYCHINMNCFTVQCVLMLPGASHLDKHCHLPPVKWP